MTPANVKFPAATAALAATLLFGATPASAQVQWVGRGIVTGSIGVQSGSQDVTTVTRQEIYEETATTTARHEIGSGPLIEISGGYLVWRNLLVGAGFSRFSDSSPASVEASIPHPLLFETFRNATVSAGDLDHSETAFHVTGTWMIPLTTKIEVALFGGPSFFSIKQEFVSGVAFTEVGDPFNAINLGAPTIAEASESAVGFHLGADVTYLVTPRIGVTGFARIARASAKFDAIDGAEIDAGGPQIGVGVRYRF